MASYDYKETFLGRPTYYRNSQYLQRSTGALWYDNLTKHFYDFTIPTGVFTDIVFLVTTLHIVIRGHQHIGGTHCLHLQVIRDGGSIFPVNLRINVPVDIPADRSTNVHCHETVSLTRVQSSERKLYQHGVSTKLKRDSAHFVATQLYFASV
jgi:hypothetical protein